MIRHSFIFLPKIDSKTESKIWEQGITDWQKFLEAKKVYGISYLRKGYYDRLIRSARDRLLNDDSIYFTKILPQTEHWRLYKYFRDQTAFIDIETNGLGKHAYITVFGLYDGYNTKIMIKDINLDYVRLKRELRKYKLLVSFNGSVFDVPFIKKRFPDLIPPIPHFDLRFACKALGIKGGLKTIEKNFNIKRKKLVEDMYGGDALTLWRMYRGSGDDYYLNLLVEYNEEDVINLRTIADIIYKQLVEKYCDEVIERTAIPIINS
jgi:hypothetical protein